MQIPVKMEVRPTAFSVPLNDVQKDQLQILAVMESVIASSRSNPHVREFTVRQLQGLADNDLPGQIRRIASFVRKSVTYVRDPVGSEYLISPENMISSYEMTGSMMGDCDDHVMLLNAMLGSIGFDTICIGVKYGSSPDYNHVISGVRTDTGIIQIDPCCKNGNTKVYTDTLTL